MNRWTGANNGRTSKLGLGALVPCHAGVYPQPEPGEVSQATREDHRRRSATHLASIAGGGRGKMAASSRSEERRRLAFHRLPGSRPGGGPPHRNVTSERGEGGQVATCVSGAWSGNVCRLALLRPRHGKRHAPEEGEGRKWKEGSCRAPSSSATAKRSLIQIMPGRPRSV